MTGSAGGNTSLVLTRREFLEASGAAALAAGLGGCTSARTSRSALTLAPVHELMASLVAQNEFPGAVWLIAHGEDVVVDWVGVTAIGGTAPMHPARYFASRR